MPHDDPAAMRRDLRAEPHAEILDLGVNAAGSTAGPGRLRQGHHQHRPVPDLSIRDLADWQQCWPVRDHHQEMLVANMLSANIKM